MTGSRMCDPLLHEMDIDSYDLPEWTGRCHICEANLTYKWIYDATQYVQAKHHFTGHTGGDINLDIGSMNKDYTVDGIFSILSDVDNDPELSKGVFILPYTAVTIIAEKDKKTSRTTEILDPTYTKLKSPTNEYGTHTWQAFQKQGGTTLNQFHDLWEKSVRNSVWLKRYYSGYYRAINKRYI